MELNVTTSSTVAADFAFARVLGTDGERDAAPGGELRGHDCFARRTRFHKIVQNAVRYRFIERSLVSI